MSFQHCPNHPAEVIALLALSLGFSTACGPARPVAVDLAPAASSSVAAAPSCLSEVDERMPFDRCDNDSSSIELDGTGRVRREVRLERGHRFERKLIWSSDGELLNILLEVDVDGGSREEGEEHSRSPSETSFRYGPHHEIVAALDPRNTTLAFAWNGTFTPLPSKRAPRVTLTVSGPYISKLLPDDLAVQDLKSPMPPLMFDGTVIVTNAGLSVREVGRVTYSRGLAVEREATKSAIEKNEFDATAHLVATSESRYTDRHEWVPSVERRFTWNGDRLVRETISGSSRAEASIEWNYDESAHLTSRVDRDLEGGVVARRLLGTECRPTPVPDSCFAPSAGP